jgi:hypothetical protein
MANNPYEGQDGYDRAWSDGFKEGHQSGDQNPTPPNVFPPYELDEVTLSYFQQVWLEGHLAGRKISPNVEHQDWERHEGLATTEEVVKRGVELASIIVKSIYHRHFASAAVELFLAVLIPSGAPRWTEEQGDLSDWFAAACGEYSWDEFFVPVIWDSSDEAPGWHGSAYTDFDSAKAEADQHLKDGHPIEIAHYRCDSPGMMEMLELGYE